MEGWQELARSGFEDKICLGNQSSYEAISISACPSQTTKYQQHDLPPDAIADHLTKPASSTADTGAAEAIIRLVRIRRRDDDRLRISSQTFHDLFKASELDPAILYLISNNSYGLHYFQSKQSTSTDGTTISSFFIATIMYVLTWSFNPKTMVTKVILMTRAHNNLHNGEAAFDDFNKTLMLYKDHIYTPLILVFVAAIQTLRYLDEGIVDQLNFLREAEAYSGHGSYEYVRKRSTASASNLNEISHWSSKVGRSVVVISNQQRHCEVVKTLIAFLTDPWLDLRDFRGQLKQGCSSRHDTALLSIQAVLQVLKRQLESTAGYHTYLAERARNQSSVLFGLLTHGDALINNKVANTSAAIAAATRKDGEAMKTIAIMTMMFLPGTFFAALFAVPSLQWGKQPVIQDGFGIYWAFTLPATLIVFLIWFLLTNWNCVYDFVIARSRTRKKRRSEKQDAFEE